MKTATWALTALAVGLLAACTPADDPSTPEPTVTASAPDTTTAAPTPTASPSPSPSAEPTNPTPSSLPTETLSAEQIAARDVVLEFFQLQNEFGMDHSITDLSPLADITTGDAQWKALTVLDQYREIGAIQTESAVSLITAIGEPSEDSSGTPLIRVESCVDSSNVDLVDTETGESVLVGDRFSMGVLELDVINDAGTWLISDFSATPTEAC